MLKRFRKIFLLFVVLLVLAGCFWIYWNRPRTVDMAAYVPAESLAFIEANDLTSVAGGITETEAWRALAAPLGAPPTLLPNKWLIALARWTGIGSTESLLLARSQVALVFTQAQATTTDNTLTIKPLAALVIETHTSQRRMRSTVERYVDQFARRAYAQPAFTRKQIDGVELAEWSSPNDTRHIVLALIDSVAIVGNDDSVVLSCIDVRRRTRRSLADDNQLATLRQQLEGAHAHLFAFVPKAGVKSAIQAWAFSRASNAADAASVAPIISNAFGNLIDAFAWTSRFDSTGAEDRCRVVLAKGVSQQLAGDLMPEPLGSNLDFSFTPSEAISVTSYQLRNPTSFWRELNTVVSSHSDALTAIASRPLLRALLEPYGVNDPDLFFSAIGPRLQLIRIENNMPAVLIAEAMDRATLRKLAEQRMGHNPKIEKLDQTEILVGSEGWSVAFEGNYFLTGPEDGVRRCLEVKLNARSLTTVPAFKRTQQSIDVSLPIVSLTMSDDRASAISFVELFSKNGRPAFSVNAPAIQQGANSLQYSAGVTLMKDDALEWTSRSSFGLIGSLFTTFAPERSR